MNAEVSRVKCCFQFSLLGTFPGLSGRSLCVLRRVHRAARGVRVLCIDEGGESDDRVVLRHGVGGEEANDAEITQHSSGGKSGSAEMTTVGNVSEVVRVKSLERTNRPYSGVDRATAKRKVAVFLSYIGSGFQGMQIQPGKPVRTVEEDLFKSLSQAGYLLESNIGSATKVKLSRSARTDTGVSCAFNCVALKCEFPRDKPMDIPFALEKIRRHLPNDLQLHGMVRARSSFSARRHCIGRTYQYLIPVKVLDPSGSMTDESLQEFERILQEYCGGMKDFVSFTKLSRVDRKSTTKRFVRKISCKFVEISGISAVAIEIQGESFIYHQIRKMMSAAILTYKKLLPPDFIQIALRGPKLFNILPAPSEMLMLRSVELRSVSSWVSGSDDVESTSLLLKNARASSESVVDSIFENMMTLETRGDIFVKWMSHVVSWYFYEEEALPLTSEIRALWETVKSVYGREWISSPGEGDEGEFTTDDDE